MCLFWTFHVNVIIQYVAFCDWLLSLMYPRFIHIVTCINIFIPFYDWIILHRMSTWHSFIHSSVGGHSGCFCSLAIKNNATMNIPTQVLHGHVVLILLGVPGNSMMTMWGTAQMFSKVPALFTFLLAMRMFWYTLANTCHCLIFLYDLSGCEGIVGLICTSLMTNDVEHLFPSYWLFIYLYWRNVYPNPLPIFNWPIYPFIVEF